MKGRTVVREDITFESNGNRLLGYLFLPEGLAAGQKVPAVVVPGGTRRLMQNPLRT
jgi:dipeptidyl aminopeptidase/acylaminoacyl peptidase